MISELFHWWGSDLVTSPTGDLLLVSGTVRGQQRVLRRLLTNSADQTQALPGDYLWDQSYGGSLPRQIGKPADEGQTASTIQSTLTLESAVAQSPPPQVSVTELTADPSGFAVDIEYEDAVSNEPVVLSFNVTP